MRSHRVFLHSLLSPKVFMTSQGFYRLVWLRCYTCPERSHKSLSSRPPLIFLAVLWRVFNLRAINTARDGFGLSPCNFRVLRLPQLTRLPLLFLTVLWRVFNLRTINTARDSFGLSTFGFYDFFGSLNSLSFFSQLPLLFLAMLWRFFNLRRINTVRDVYLDLMLQSQHLHNLSSLP